MSVKEKDYKEHEEDEEHKADKEDPAGPDNPVIGIFISFCISRISSASVF